MRPGEPQSQPLPPGQQVRQPAAAGEEVIEELEALGLFPPGDGQVRPLEALGGGGDGVIGGPQHGQARGAQRRDRAGRARKITP